MRSLATVTMLAGFVLVSLGCGKPNRPVEGPFVEAFVGKVVRDGKPVTFPENEDVQLEVVHRKSAYHFGIPLKPDGTWTIGWMPIGDYSVTLERTPKGSHQPRKQGVPGGLKIEEGKTEYTIELGKARQS
jgi:hypothetical protein